jgi:hypothetical protein
VIVVCGALLLALTIAIGTAWGSATTVRVTLRSNGTEVNHDADEPAISANGRFVSFESTGHFAPGDSGPYADVFVRDVNTGKTTQASLKSNETESMGDCEGSALSGSARFVAFTCDDSLVPGDTNAMLDVYVRDRSAGTTRRVSVKTGGGQAFADSENPDISADGRYVVWQTDGQFVPGDTNGKTDIYIRDRQNNTTKRLSVNSSEQQQSQDSEDPSISGDGRFVAWDSGAVFTGDPDFAVNQINGGIDVDVFVRDRKNGTTRRASLKSNGTEASSSENISSRNPALSADGHLVAFESNGLSGFVPADTNNDADIYVKNMTSGGITRASVRSNGSQGGGPSTRPDISGAGRFVTFETYSKLVSGDTNSGRDVYVRDRKTKTTRWISVKNNGTAVNYNHELAQISGDGRFVAFDSLGAFTSGDAGSDFDVFRRGPLF